MRKFFFLVILSICFLFCTGCYDAVEIDELAYVVALGIDKSESNTYRITLQYAVPLNIAGGIDGTKGEDAPVSSMTFDADSLHLALDSANGKIAKITDLSHLSVIVIGKDAAQTDLTYLKDDIKSIADLRQDAAVAICDGKAEELLNNVSSPLDLNPSRFYKEFFSDSATGFGLKQSVSAFLSPDKALSLPFLAKSDRLEIAGMAILKENSLFKIYPAQDILLYNLLSTSVSNLKYQTEHGIYRIDANAKPQISVRPEQPAVISVSLDLTGEPLSGKDFLFSDNQKATQDIKSTLQKDLFAFLEKTQKDNCDILNFANRLKPHFATETRLNNYLSRYDYASATFSVRISFRNTKT